MYKKYLVSKFINVLPFEESFFFTVAFEKKVKLTDALIALNYKKNAPYKEAYFSKFMEEKNLYLWFYEKEIEGKIVVPEGYLLFNYFKEKNPNAFLLFEGNEGYNVIVIKNSTLVKCYTLASKDKMLTSMEMNKYGLDVYQEIAKKEYLQSKKEALERIGVNELYQWSNIDFNQKEFLPTLVNKITYPLSFLLFFMMGVQVYHATEVQKELTMLEANYFKVKTKNEDVREKINAKNAKTEQWVTFVHEELPYADSLSVFVAISKAFTPEKFIFKTFSIVGSKVKIEMESKEDFVKGLNILSKVKELKNVTIKFNNRSKNRVAYEATIISKGASL